jgi:hypothetical protein
MYCIPPLQFNREGLQAREKLGVFRVKLVYDVIHNARIAFCMNFVKLGLLA